MFNLGKALYDHELIVLRVIGEWWELDLTGMDKSACISALTDALSQLNMKEELNYLDEEEAAALEGLVASAGRSSVAIFERHHGMVRQMGPGLMEREEPWLDPVSPAEALWYRGFLYRAFDETEGSELVEYYYLPTEFYQQFAEDQPASKLKERQEQAFLPSAIDPDQYLPAEIDAVDDITSLLAAAQNQPIQDEEISWLRSLFLNTNMDRVSLLVNLAWELKLLRASDHGARPTRQIVSWLQKGRDEQLRDLANGWSKCLWNELCHTPEIACEGSGWQNDPILSRTALLDAIPRTGEWYELNNLINYMKLNDPDFQRPDGNYDTWYLRDLKTDTYLTGFDSWDLVEGRLIQYLIQGPMYWLGLVEIGSLNDKNNLLFRLTARSLAWLNNKPIVETDVDVPIVVHDDATISVPFNANRYHRFQVARVAEADPIQPGQPFKYRLTPQTLNRARDQGIDPERVLAFLAKNSGRAVPQSTERSVKRWAQNGTEAFLEDVVLLRVRDPETLEKLRANPKTRLYIAESTGELTAIVRRGDWRELRQAAARLGLLLDHRDQIN